MSAYFRQDEVFFSRRTVTVTLILGLHALIIYALATGLGPHALRILTTRTEVVALPDHLVDRQPPPLPDPKINDSFRRFDIPNPQQPQFEPVDPERTVTVANVPQVEGTGTSSFTPPEPVKRVLGGPGKNFPATDEYYPADALRRGLEGPVTVQACVDEKGRLTEAPTVARSSGSSILDEGALRLAKAGSGHYRPTTEDGRAVSSCYPFRITFRMMGH
jgi:protein TonB